MAIRLSTSKLNETLIFQNTSQDLSGKNSFREWGYSLNHPAMEADFDEWEFDGFSIRHGKVKLKEDVEIAEENPIDSIVMYFNLSGNSNTFLHDSGQSICFSGKQHNLIYTPTFKASFKADASTEVNDKLEIHIPEKYFQRITGDDGTMLHHFRQQVVSKKTSLLYKHPINANAAMNQCVSQILQTQKKGGLKRIYLESKILELFSLQLEQHQNLLNVQNAKLKKADIEKLYHAKTIIEENITTPCSLIDLAHKVGINDFKLKSGFKALFGKTVFGYLRELRMQKANELLQENELTITEIAEYCGYEYVQHFITAFKKNYGVTPGYFTIQRKDGENHI